ncbi:MAG: HAD family phosphatase [Eubacterium sp.]|nr:HAD family phosphatase [Eubacterium sp.]
MNFKNTKSIIFDMDGIIFDTERLYVDCCVEVGNKYGIEHVEEACYKCIGITSEESRKVMLSFYGNDFDLERFRKEVDVLFAARFEAEPLVKPGVRELLTYLKGEDKKIAIASSTKKESVERELRMVGIIDYFDEIVCGDMVGKSKPAPDIFIEAAHRLGSEPEECVVIEDSFNGIRAAHAAGAFSIMVPDMLSPDDEMKEKASIILNSLLEVRDYLKDQN